MSETEAEAGEEDAMADVTDVMEDAAAVGTHLVSPTANHHLLKI